MLEQQARLSRQEENEMIVQDVQTAHKPFRVQFIHLGADRSVACVGMYAGKGVCACGVDTKGRRATNSYHDSE